MKTVLSIAGSDPSGGAGIQADLKTITCLGEYGMSVITGLTLQNTMGVYEVMNIPAELIQGQMDAVFQDIYPDAVKIGMIATPDILKGICEKLEEWKPKQIVVDPVMVATSGASLMQKETIKGLKEQLIPLADIISPNLQEAEVLSGVQIINREDMIRAAQKIREYYTGGILIKGGHLTADASDLLYRENEAIWFHGKRYDNPNTHGTGCTLSSAIATYLAKGCSLEESVKRAKDYVAGAIAFGMDLGKGRGPLCHNYFFV